MLFRAILIVFAAAALFASAAAGQTPAQATDTTTTAADPPDIAMQVDGMTCPFCSFGLEKKLLALAATDSVDIKLSEGVVHVFLKPGEKLSDAELRKAVKDAGFSAGKIERRTPPDSG